jgi:NADPH:quinone reductase-like Zn-dependent oxidoreductase
LVTGASGGVGVFAIQLAAAAGDQVTAAIRNPAHEALVRRLGAADVLIGEFPADNGGPFDLVVESVGGETLGAALGRLAPGGICVVLGASAGAVTTFDVSKFRVGGTSLYGLVMQWEFQSEPPAVGLAELLELLRENKLKTVIERRAPMSDIAGVARDLVDRRFVGKAVLTW